MSAGQLGEPTVLSPWPVFSNELERRLRRRYAGTQVQAARQRCSNMAKVGTDARRTARGGSPWWNSAWGAWLWRTPLMAKDVARAVMHDHAA
jgi:hypothetical protein